MIMVGQCHSSQTLHHSLRFSSLSFFFDSFFRASPQTCKQCPRNYLDSEAPQGKLRWYSVSQPTVPLLLYPQPGPQREHFPGVQRSIPGPQILLGPQALSGPMPLNHFLSGGCRSSFKSEEYLHTVRTYEKPNLT